MHERGGPRSPHPPNRANGNDQGTPAYGSDVADVVALLAAAAVCRDVLDAVDIDTAARSTTSRRPAGSRHSSRRDSVAGIESASRANAALKPPRPGICDGREYFGTPCSADRPLPAKFDLILCDQHEIERRAKLAGLTAEQFVRNTGWPAPGRWRA
jgi:hypothetical protein